MVYNLDSFSVIVVRARLAQSVEHQTFNLRVMGSRSPVRIRAVSNRVVALCLVSNVRQVLLVIWLTKWSTIIGSFSVIVVRARLAQSVEHQTFNLRVMGSSPLAGVSAFCCLFL